MINRTYEQALHYNSTQPSSAASNAHDAALERLFELAVLSGTSRGVLMSLRGENARRMLTLTQLVRLWMCPSIREFPALMLTLSG
jgi:hypothetical protein